MPEFRVQVTAVASIWREERVEAADAAAAERVALERAERDRAYEGSLTQWELNGRLEADPVTNPEIANFCRLEVTRVECAVCGEEVVRECHYCAERHAEQEEGGDDDGKVFDLELGRFVREGEP